MNVVLALFVIAIATALAVAAGGVALYLGQHAGFSNWAVFWLVVAAIMLANGWWVVVQWVGRMDTRRETREER